MKDTIRPRQRMRGQVRLYDISARSADWLALTDWHHNEFLYEWGAIFGNLLARNGLNYGIGGMYLEYQNVAAPGDTVPIPSFTRDAGQGAEYYAGLALSSDSDYLRVPLISALMSSTDTVNYPLGNQITFMAQSAGLTGQTGKAFSDGVNSTIYGAALVAFVDPTDPTQDIVLSRAYLPTESQQVKLASSQLGVQWQVVLE